MAQLSTEQLLYLLYAVAYSTEGTVTKGTVKKHLSKKSQNDAEKICKDLSDMKLLESPKRGRLAVTDMGMRALVTNLQTTDYKFNSQQGVKVLNTLLYCVKLAASDPQTYSGFVEDMDFETFVEKFKKLYFEERRRQERRGVVAIHSRELCQKFMEDNPISQAKLKQYFDRLKEDGYVFAVTEIDEELIQWGE
jgi:hypothetical protein